MDELIQKVTGMHRSEFEKAENREKYSWIAELIVVIAAIVVIFVNEELVIYTSSVVALGAAILSWTLSYFAKKHRSIAERARRFIVLNQGLGYEVSRKELIELLASFSVTEDDGRVWVDKEYYRSSADTGHAKFAQMLQESAFYSSHLYEASAKRSRIWLVAASGLAVVTMFTLPTITIQSWSIAVAQIVSVVLIFLISIDLLGRTLDFFEASSRASGVDDRVEHFLTVGAHENDLIMIWGDYNATVQDAPIIPTSIYERNKERLNKLYSKRTNSNSTTST